MAPAGTQLILHFSTFRATWLFGHGYMTSCRASADLYLHTSLSNPNSCPSQITYRLRFEIVVFVNSHFCIFGRFWISNVFCFPVTYLTIPTPLVYTLIINWILRKEVGSSLSSERFGSSITWRHASKTQAHSEEIRGNCRACPTSCCNYCR